MKLPTSVKMVAMVLTLGWIGALRFAVKSFWISPVGPWTCWVLTVASAIFVAGKAGSGYRSAAKFARLFLQAPFSSRSSETL
jgi:hypothetical protein